MLASESLLARVTTQQREFVAGVIVAILAITVFMVWRRTETPSMESAAPTAVRSLVVLPLQGASDVEYLSSGVAEELAAALASVPGLRIAPAPAAFPLERRSPEDLRELATLINVGAVLHGTLRRTGKKLELTLSLTSVSDDSSLRIVQVSRDTSDLAGLENETARSVARVLRAQLGLPETPVVAVTTRDRLAHALVMRALYVRRRRSKAALDSAVDLLDEAVRRDSAYARAWSALAGTTAHRTTAMSAARRAIALDSTLAEPHLTLGRLHAAAGETEQALREYLAAIRLDPRLAAARYEYSRLLAASAQLDEALREARRAHELDPLAEELHRNYAQMLGRAGHELAAQHELSEMRRIARYLRARQ